MQLAVERLDNAQANGRTIIIEDSAATLIPHIPSDNNSFVNFSSLSQRRIFIIKPTKQVDEF